MTSWQGISGGVVFITVSILALLARGNPGPNAADMGPLEIGPETTRIVAPLTDDGLVDYVVALNKTPAPDAADNAAIELLRVLGTEALVGDVPDVLARLGAPPGLPATGLFVAASEDVDDALYATDERHERAGNALIAAWIADNQAALDTFVDASRRPQLWWPVVDRWPGQEV